MDINLDKQSEQQVFNTKEDIIKDINNTHVWEYEGIDDRESLKQEKSSYFERMINNSKDENLKLKYRQSQLQVDAMDIGFDAIEPYTEMTGEKNKLVRKLPVVKQDGKWTSSEKKELGKFKKEHNGADLCTLREYEGLTEYFKDGGFSGFNPKGEEKDAEVKEFIESIMDTEVTMGLFNDDYLSQHISELYDYTLKLKDVPNLEKKYPAYFNGLPTAKRAVLEAKVNCADEIEAVLTSHMRLHGITILKGQDGYEAKLVKYPDSKSFIDLDKKNCQFNYNRALNDLADKINNKGVVKTAEVFVKGEIYKKESALKSVEEKAAADPQNYNLFREQYKYAYGAIKRAGEIRDEIIDSLKDLINKSNDKYISEEERENARIQIKNCNRKILVASRHMEYYGEYLDFLNGKTGGLSKSTKEFLRSDGDSSIMETLWALKHIEDNMDEDDPGIRDEFIKTIKSVRENADFILLGLDDEDEEEEEKKTEKKKDEEKKEEKTEEKKDEEKTAEKTEEEKKEEPEEIIVEKAAEKELSEEEKIKRIIKREKEYLEKREERRKDPLKEYTRENRERYENILKGFLEHDEKVPKDLENMQLLRSRYMIMMHTELDDYKGDYYFKSDTDEKLYDALNWLIEYHRYHTVEKKEKQNKVLVKVEIPDYDIDVKPLIKYEAQTGGSQNCWCCAGTAIFKQFMKNQGKKLAHEPGQEDMRAFAPKEHKTLEEIRRTGLNLDEDVYRMYYENTVSYMGKGKKKVGNIFEAADFFFKYDKDFMLNRMLIQVPGIYRQKDNKRIEKTAEEKKHDEIIINNQKAAFLKQVKKVLDSGNMVAVLNQNPYAHYRTITGIHKGKITYLDSMGGTSKTSSIDDFFIKQSDDADAVELTWFSKLRKPEELQKEFGNLTYDKETKEFGTESLSMESALNIFQTKGVCVGKEENEMEEAMVQISYSVYIPKQASGEQGHK